MGGKNGKQSNEDIVRAVQNNHDLHGDAKILMETFLELAKGGMTQEEKKKLEDIDRVLPNAAIQLQKDGSAKILEDSGHVSLVKPTDTPHVSRGEFIKAVHDL